MAMAAAWPSLHEPSTNPLTKSSMWARVKLVTRDDAYEPDKAVTAVKALNQTDKVFALTGAVAKPTGCRC